ncbi:MAG: NAD(P)H-binding protein [Woeseiaceae bacterium]|nr:NAD(P)H-binding protein [Woeseiaceae bacterium]
MKKVLVAGSTGYLGRFVVKALKARGYRVRALGRSEAKLQTLRDHADELFVGEVTDLGSLTGVFDGIDIVFSSVGITRQKDGLTYYDVDFQANRNLLMAAEASGVAKFVYVHVLNADKMAHVAAVRAKQAFVNELKRSSLARTVICPTGFFSDMEEFITMAKRGRIYLFGDGMNRINPIHGADLAEVCVDAMDCPEEHVDVGGPEVLTYREIAELAFGALGNPVKITSVPRRLVSAMVKAMCWLTPVKIYGPVEFMSTVMTMDVVGDPRGHMKLAHYFRSISNGRDARYTEEEHWGVE